MPTGGKSTSFFWEHFMRVVQETDKPKTNREIPDRRSGERRKASVRDIRDWRPEEERRRNLESRRRTDRNMAALSTLAGGIAHQFNNALFGILGNLELLIFDFPDNDTLGHYVKSMEASIRRLTQLTNQLLAYARGGKYEPKVFSLRDFIMKTLPPLLHDLLPEIRVTTDLQGDLTLVNADQHQLRIVLSVLLKNAVEAIEGPGYIRILMRNEELTEPGQNLPPGPYICLIIEDDGKGMDQKTVDRIFEPFFTTKFYGRGLGMAAAYGIVKNHGGWISVNSEPDLGTAVHVYLPVADTPS